MTKKKHPLEMLLDENNNENVFFEDQDGNFMEFEQIALLDIEDTSYTLLHPLHMGYDKDEVIVYAIMQFEDTFELLEVEDKALLKEIDLKYQNLLKKKTINKKFKKNV